MKRPPIFNIVRFTRAPRGMRGGLLTPQQLAQAMLIGEKPQGINPSWRQRKRIKTHHPHRKSTIRRRKRRR